ncbi:hypothetical protein OROMI_031903 [Orobanche minor]
MKFEWHFRMGVDRFRLLLEHEFVWTRPDVGWCKLNTDASLVGSTRSVAGGGLMRGADGCWICGFSIKLKNVSINVAELLALWEGLRVAWKRRIQKLVAELDSEVVLKLFMSLHTREHPLHYILEDCRSFQRFPSEFQLQHTKRDGNIYANILAKMGHDCEAFHFWDKPPLALVAAIESDIEASG